MARAITYLGISRSYGQNDFVRIRVWLEDSSSKFHLFHHGVDRVLSCDGTTCRACFCASRNEWTGVLGTGQLPHEAGTNNGDLDEGSSYRGKSQPYPQCQRLEYGLVML